MKTQGTEEGEEEKINLEKSIQMAWHLVKNIIDASFCCHCHFSENNKLKTNERLIRV